MLDGCTIVGLERVEVDPAGVELGQDVAVGEQHGATLAHRQCVRAWTGNTLFP